MSDSLKDRLNSHSDAFKGLLSLIPAKYYYDDESKSQWNRKKATKSDAHRVKQAKFDPSQGSSALDEVTRRETDAVVSKSGADSIEVDSFEQEVLDEESDSDISVIFDDHGNEIRLSGDAPDSSDDLPVQPAKVQEKPAKKASANPKVTQAESKRQPSSEAQPEKKSSAKPAAKRDAQGIEELRKKLADKITEMKIRRKAPGTNAPGAPKNREELLAARKQRQDIKKRKWDETDAASDGENIDENHSLAEDVDTPERASNEETIIFGQIKLGDGNKLGLNLSADEQKVLKRRNAADQLRVLESRKAKISSLPEAKQTEIANKAQWSRAILQSEGAKVRDNEKLLKKTVKQQQRRKLKSELQWKDRLDTVAKGIASREAKRNANLAARKEAKFSKGKKKKPKRAGFEGKKRRK
ncbi:Ribosomal RNA-processing protein 14 [Wickerhamiella sorbophila]|uniref:Ribosomal RNA-processing protein 14 n=1 Tax=Wickerhamiella sorbophila TaxID=45607 RepID=A0A2T0FKE4_9ASCO|nr:Ribosomal RNA-processing protein 14 [Wickerhamiella sorbophila]PRT55452.1 Ribosomal RNA-processing protein 14 [Wickerhamiella sorbophila]